MKVCAIIKCKKCGHDCFVKYRSNRNEYEEIQNICNWCKEDLGVEEG